MRKENKICRSVKQKAVQAAFREVLIALSGGADSVAAALVLLQSGLKLRALHANFHLRGDESNRDMDFVSEFCKRKGLPLEVKHFDVEKYQNLHPGTSIEMACRELRHGWFAEMKESTGADRIVTGHNADDNIETLFLNLMRGSGTKGLKGMTEDNGTIWRPLLRFHRSEILEFLNREKENYVTDSTNLESDYRRNFIRNKILPLIREEWKGADKALDKTIENLYYENLIIEKSVERNLPNGRKPLTAEEILRYPAPLLLIKRYIEDAGPYSTTPGEILSAIKANKPHIREWRLKNGRVYLRNRRLSVEISHGESCT